MAFTTYQGGRIFFVGGGPEGRINAFGSNYSRSMGLALSQDGRSILLATQVQIFRFDNILVGGANKAGHDAVFAPHQTWITGDLDVHDVGIGADGAPIFVNALFNCLATVSPGYSFRPVWKPPFISAITAEDRCHLNGMAMLDGRPRYVTCISRSDAVDGWRDRRDDGGVVVDVDSGEVVASGLSMPHSPRIYRDKLWLLNSGTGEFGWIDIGSGVFNPVTFCPGFARGLSFFGDHAVIGLSQLRESNALRGLRLETELRDRDVVSRCGLIVVDLNSGATTEWVRIEGSVSELFDVAVLPKIQNPIVVGLKGNDIARTILVDDRKLAV